MTEPSSTPDAEILGIREIATKRGRDPILKFSSRPSEPPFVRERVRVASWYNYDPSGAPLKARSIATQLRRSYLSFVLFILLGSLTSLILLLVAILTGFELLFLFMSFGVPASMLGVCLIFHWSRTKSAKAVEGLDTAFQVSLNTGAHEYGRDVGQLSVENGWLHFDGERTSFSLSIADVSKRTHPRKFLTRIFVDRGALSLRIRIEPVAPSRRSRDFLGKSLVEWRTSSPPMDGISLLPPLELEPNGNYDVAAGNLLPLLFIVPHLMLMLPMVYLDSGALGAMAVFFGEALLFPLAVLIVVFRGRNRSLKKLAECATELSNEERGLDPRDSVRPLVSPLPQSPYGMERESQSTSQ